AGARMFCLMGKKENDSILLDELARITGRVTGSIAGRLSELVREQLIERVGKGSYRLTTMGQRAVIQTLLPKAMQLPERQRAMTERPKIKVQIEWGDIKHTDEGELETDVQEVMRFAAHVVHNYSIASHMTYSP